MHGYAEIVKLLVEKGVSLETKDRNGCTPLLLAAVNQHAAVVKLLIEKGVNTKYKDGQGRDLLLWTVMHGYEGVVKVLIEKGAYLELKDQNGPTPISLAARHGHTAVVGILTEHGANLKNGDWYGKLPLSWTATYGHEGVTNAPTVSHLWFVRSANDPDATTATPLARQKEPINHGGFDPASPNASIKVIWLTRVFARTIAKRGCPTEQDTTNEISANNVGSSGSLP
ncbi:unnamed protein product [Aspergillus oryzae var. brunneus]|uniref:Unnamed protein product n=2 Tax=Aspergillus oryzae TaxID=5062 RepID=A0AAN4YLY1_ASPOZ|nr:unnamed protein product [Aspergillus oryzae]GMG29635.1 unnamed protein product [Aspergillus oryzae]GMG49565.1 unnamed protein product [Aspergillus oryzae var. brunneus]